MNHTGERERAFDSLRDRKQESWGPQRDALEEEGPEELSVWISQMSGRGTVPDVQEGHLGVQLVRQAAPRHSLLPPSLPPPSMSGHRVPPQPRPISTALPYAVTLTEG